MFEYEHRQISKIFGDLRKWCVLALTKIRRRNVLGVTMLQYQKKYADYTNKTLLQCLYEIRIGRISLRKTEEKSKFLDEQS